METSDYRLILIVKAMDKLTQMSGRSGNELIINRGQFLHQGQAVSVPQLSANGMRHAAVREPGGMWLIDTYELGERLLKEQLRLLLNGGNNATQSGGAESLGRFVAMRQALPLLGLMGCGLPDGPKAGTLRFSDAVLLCNETRDFAHTVAGEILQLPEYLRPARNCVCKWTNYRHDSVQQMASYLEPKELLDYDHAGMIFGGEAIVAGSLLLSEIRLESATPLEFGALLWSLRLWQSKGGIVGGMSARGNGRTVSMVHCDGDCNLDEIANDYATYAVSQRESAIQWMNDVYGAKPEKAKGKGKKKEPEPVA